MNRDRLRGATLIELLFVMALMGLVIAAIYSIHYSSQKTYAVQEQVVAMQQNARSAIDLLAQELHLAGYDPNPLHLAAPKARIIQAAPTLLEFRADLNGNGTTDAAGDENEHVVYSYTGGVLTRGTGESVVNQVIAGNIVNFQFAYFLIADGSVHGFGAGVDDDGDGTTDQVGELLMTGDPSSIPAVLPFGLTPLELIRLVRITLTAQAARPDPNYGPNGGYRRYTLTADVSPRNIPFVQ